MSSSKIKPGSDGAGEALLRAVGDARDFGVAFPMARKVGNGGLPSRGAFGSGFELGIERSLMRLSISERPLLALIGDLSDLDVPFVSILCVGDGDE